MGLGSVRFFMGSLADRAVKPRSGLSTDAKCEFAKNHEPAPSHAYPHSCAAIVYDLTTDTEVGGWHASSTGRLRRRKPAAPIGLRRAGAASKRVWAERGGFLFECADCDHQTSLTSGTLLEKTRKPFKVRFRAVFETLLSAQRHLGQGAAADLGAKLRQDGVELAAQAQSDAGACRSGAARPFRPDRPLMHRSKIGPVRSLHQLAQAMEARRSGVDQGRRIRHDPKPR